MAAISSLFSPNLLQQPTKPFRIQTQASKPSFQATKQASIPKIHGFVVSPFFLNPKETLIRTYAVAEETSVSSATDRRLYVGNIPRTVDNSELEKLFAEHGAVENVEVMYDKWSKRSRRFAFVTMKTVEDANAAIEKMNGTEIGGRQIKVNVTEKPLEGSGSSSPLQVEDSNFIDSPHKVYVGNVARTVTTESLIRFFSGKGKVLSAKVTRPPGTSKSNGFAFVTYSSEEGVETAISALNDIYLEGQKIRVNKA